MRECGEKRAREAHEGRGRGVPIFSVNSTIIGKLFRT